MTDIRSSLAKRGLIRDVSPQSRLIDGLVALVGALIMFAMTYGMFPYGTQAPTMAGLALITAIQWGAFALGRWSPAIALALAWVGAIVQMALFIEPMPVNLAIVGVVYATAAWGTRAVMWAGLISSFVGAGVAAVYLGISTRRFEFFNPDESVRIALVSGFFTLIVLLLGWAFGMVWRAYRRSEQRHAEAREAEARTAEEAERVAIARDMHDVVAHSLAVVLAQANGARYIAESDPEATKQALSTISMTAGDALKDVRLLLAQLRHRQGELPQPMLSDVETLFDRVRATGRELQVETDGNITALPAAIQLAAYRVLQEAISNALRHGTGPIVVGLEAQPEQFELSVSNAVVPAQTEPIRTGAVHAARGAGHGIIGMRERVALVGGGLRAQQVGDQFVVYAQFPLTQQGAQ